MFIESADVSLLDGTCFPMPENASHDDHWRRNLRITAALLGVWLAVSFGVSFFSRELGARWFGWPFGFWVAAQGAPLVYVLLVWLYAWRMRRLDRRLAPDEGH